MGAYASQVWWSGADDPVDELRSNSLSGLTKHDIKTVQKSWAKISPNEFLFGAELLKRYFRAFPEGKKLFPALSNIPDEELDTNAKFKAHVTSFMKSFDLGVNSIDEPLVAAALMQKLGTLHGKLKIQEQDFLDLKYVLLELLADLKLNKSALRAWKKTIEFWYKNIFITLSAAASA